ncbi:MAG TPA: hypothetical protein VI316_00035 [Candidatus Dormibacteraeota bacterium]
MAGRLRMLKQLLLELPRNLKLAYCLAYDPRVPLVNKMALGAALGLIVTPFIDIPEWIPVVGELNVLALTLLATHLFIVTADAELVASQELLIAQRRSRFDLDVASGRRVATAISRHFGGRIPSTEPDAAGSTADAAAADQGVHG